MYFAMVGSVISIPSFSNSPRVRGAPQRGLLRLSIRIRCRISCDTLGRPSVPGVSWGRLSPDGEQILYPDSGSSFSLSGVGALFVTAIKDGKPKRRLAEPGRQ